MGQRRLQKPIELRARGILLGSVYFLETGHGEIPSDIDGRVGMLFELLRTLPPRLGPYVRELTKEKPMVALYTGVFGSVKNARPVALPRRKLATALRRALLRAKLEVPSRPTIILVLPRYLREGKGIDGLTTGWNVLAICVNPRQSWQKALEEVLCHEYFHAVRDLQKPKDRTIGALLVEEGLATHFTQYLLGRRDNLTIGTESRAERLLQELRPKLYSRDDAAERRLFIIGRGRERILDGYTMGYYLTKPFIKTLSNLTWKQVADLSATKILRMCEYLWWGKGGRALWKPRHRKRPQRR